MPPIEDYGPISTDRASSDVSEGMVNGPNNICDEQVLFFNHTATTEIYTLSLHDALPIYRLALSSRLHRPLARRLHHLRIRQQHRRSEEHTSELQSRLHLVCRLLLEKSVSVSVWLRPHRTRGTTARQ